MSPMCGSTATGSGTGTRSTRRWPPSTRRRGPFTLAKPYSQYGYRKGQRYHALNVLRELDHPGEWYLDRRRGPLYWLPPDGRRLARAGRRSACSTQPFVAAGKRRHVILRGLTLEEGRGDGIHVRGGADCLVAGCTLRRLGGDAIVVEGGRRHMACSAARSTRWAAAACAWRAATARRSSPAATSWRTARSRTSRGSKRTYTPAVHVDGCGNRIAHNRFEHIPSSALRIEGNDHLIELNAIHDVVEESDDQGGLDMFGNPLYRGVVIRWNRWSDIRGGTHSGAAGVRLDDMISGVAVYGNVFERCGAVPVRRRADPRRQGQPGRRQRVPRLFRRAQLLALGRGRWREGIARFQPEAAKGVRETHIQIWLELSDDPGRQLGDA